jgi:predicted DNA-binding protein
MMIRFNSYLPAPLLKRLRAMAVKQGITMAELIRRAVEEFLK